MTRFEILGRIVEHLHGLDNASLEELLVDLSEDITDESLETITYGEDDTKHLKSSSINAEDLDQAVEELKGQELLTSQHAS